MSEARLSKKTIGYGINTIIVLAFMFGFGHLPPFGTVTSQGMEALGILFGLFYGWTFIEMIWPSVVSFLALAYWSGDTLVNYNMSGFGNNIVVMIIFLFAFAYYLDKSGLTKYIAEWFISRKIAIGRPWVMAYLIYVCCLVLTALLTTPYPSMLFCWGIIYQICESAGYKKKDKVVTMLLGGVTIAGGYSALFFPWAIMSVAYLGALENALGVSPNFFLTLITFSSFGLIALAIYSVVCKYIFRIDLSALKEGGDRYSHLRGQKMSENQKQAAVIMIFFVASISLMSVLPSEWPIIGLLSKWDVTGIAMCVITIMAILRTKKGETKFDVSDFLVNGVKWPIVMMLAATTPISTLLESDEAGIMNWIISVTVPFLSSLSPVLCVTLVVVFLTLLTQVCHNLVLGVVFIPIFAPIMAELGIDPAIFVLLLSIGLQTAFVSPASAGQTAMLYSNTEWVKIVDVYKFMIAGLIIGLVLLVVIYIPIMMVLFN